MRTQSSDPVTTKDVLYALGRYRIESNESDRQTATKLGINRLTLKAWLRGVDPPQRCLLARLAGFLRRAGYLSCRLKSRDDCPSLHMIFDHCREVVTPEKASWKSQHEAKVSLEI
jgi:transcriptional regulator with XRE-family HTH domain